MSAYTLYQVDAFTKTRFTGNPAGVVPDARGLSDAQMQHIARELNNSETAFLFPPDDATCDAVIRYFTPRAEVPVCGHATIAALHTKAVEEQLGSCVLRYKTGIGVLPVEIRKTDHDYTIAMTQGPFTLGAPLTPAHRETLLAALGLTNDDLIPGCPVQIASTGYGKVMVGVSNRDTLHRLTPSMAQLADLSGRIDCNGYCVFTLDAEAGYNAHVRVFAPVSGIPEDPVTGNANGPLAAYLLHHKILEPAGDRFQFRARQGEAMGRPGTIEVTVTVKDEKPH